MSPSFFTANLASVGKRQFRPNSPGRGHQSSSARSNADPRQNRNNNNNSHKKSFSQGSSEKHKQGRASEDTQRANDNKTAPADRAVNSEGPEESAPKAGHNPLDFLTQFINKSSTGQSGQEAAADKSSANLSYLVSSLKKFVNNAPGSAGHGGASTSEPLPLMSNSFQSSFISGDSQQLNSP